MIRDIVPSFLNWKGRKSRKPLLVRGARQVGKTYAIEQFAKDHFSSYLKVNLEEQKELLSIFSKNDAPAIINELELYFNTRITPGESLLFIDEIQSCPEAIVALRYFYEQVPGVHVIAAGSLLDHTLNDTKYPMPVGRIEFLYMYPLSFKEFLTALGEQNLVQHLESFTLRGDFSPLLHTKLLGYLRIYFFVGGMPEAVELYRSEKKFTEIGRIHSSIITSLQYDFSKYGSRREQLHLGDVMKYSANHVGKKIKYVNVSRDVRSLELKEAFRKLELSRIVHLVRYSNASGVPMSNLVNENIYKVLFFDIGLANSIGGIQLVGIPDLVTLNEGALAEQFIGQELLTVGNTYDDRKLYYWLREKKNANAEIDYLLQYNNNIFPVEVKAGKSGTLKSLHVYLYEKKLRTGIRFNLNLPSIGNLEAKVTLGKSSKTLQYKLISLPLYMCFILPGILRKCLKESE